MPRRRFITMVCLTVVVIACAFIAYFVVNRSTSEPSFQGRTASSWLREVFGNRGLQGQAMEAFRQMGTNADPILVAAIASNESLFAKTFRRYYHQLPSVIRRRLPEPEDLRVLRSAATLVLINRPHSEIVPQLLPLLKVPDSGLRQEVLVSVDNLLGPKDASQIPMLLLATNDPEVMVRMMALRALWKIDGQTNTAVPGLEAVLRQSPDARHRHWAAVYLMQMRHADPLLTTTFINSLTNGQSGLRMSACACLGQIGPPAAAALPALRQALQDPDPQVRRQARTALARIDPAHADVDGP